MAEDHADPDDAGLLHHVELSAEDLEAAVNFWDWLLGALGYRGKDAWDGSRSWIRGPTYGVVAAAGRPDHPFDRAAPGLNHLAFHAESREQVDEITAGVREPLMRRCSTRTATPTRAVTTRCIARARTS